MTTLAIDAMSGDGGLDVTLPATLDAARRHPRIQFILVGEPGAIEAAYKRDNITPPPGVTLRAATQVVDMHDDAAFALRKKKDSSMRVGVNLVQSGEADACVSAGNTGALMATARFVLHMLRGIERPAICVALPRIDGQTFMLDLGANVESPPEILHQFGVMGVALIQCLSGDTAPSVGLLNIGTEELKGNDKIKAAAELFRQSDLNYAGFVEADEIYTGKTDLVVCDGFAGNVALKASEGVAQMIGHVMREEFKRGARARASALMASPALKRIKNRLDHRRYNGASLLGLRGAVIKSHGGTDALGFQHAIDYAIEQARNGLVGKIESAMAA